MEPLRLSLELKQVPVVLEKDGVERQCVLKELTGAQRNIYLGKLTSRVRVNKEGKAMGITSFKGFQADLLSHCFYNEEDQLFSVEEIEELPSSTQQMLFDTAQELSGLDVEGGDEEKND